MWMIDDEPRRRRGAPEVPIDAGKVAAAFARDGYHGATMASVARHAGVAKPTLYRRFASKEQLFEMALAGECEALLERLTAAYRESEPWPLRERIRHGIAAYFEFARERPDGFRLLFHTDSDRSPQVNRMVEETVRGLVDALAEGHRRDLRAAGSPDGQVAEMLAAAVVGMSDYVARLQLRHHPEWDEDATIDLLTDLWMGAVIHVPRRTLVAADTPRARLTPRSP
jgi:AcrR family transcriptional regulator